MNCLPCRVVNCSDAYDSSRGWLISSDDVEMLFFDIYGFYDHVLICPVIKVLAWLGPK